MSSLSSRLTLLLTIFIFSLVACTPIFENNYDAMARQAPFDLVQAQNNYWEKHNKYSKGLAQLQKHNLKYHTGIVYLEIQSASKDGYRAISLPAESTTARVFIYDTTKGGFYEADEVEVSKYVLGALNFIRDRKGKEKINTFVTTILLSSLFILGFRFTSRYKGKENNYILLSYFISLLPLGWAIAAINHLTSEIVFSSKIKILSLIAITLSLTSSFIATLWLKNKNLLITPAPVLGLAGCILFTSIASAGVVIYTVYKYYPI